MKLLNQLKKIRGLYQNISLFVILLSYNQMTAAYANIIQQEEETIGNIGDAARNMSGALGNIIQLILTVTTLAGVGFCCSALAKLYQHKKNPQQVPISQFFIVLVLGVVLISLPFILKFSESTYNQL